MDLTSCPIAFHARISPSHLAIEEDLKSYSYKELHLLVCSYEKMFSDHFTDSEARLGLLSHPTIETIACYFAALRQGKPLFILSHKDPPHLLAQKKQELGLTHLFNFQEASHLIEGCISQATLFLDQIATYLYTSGSSSSPKIVALSYGNHAYSALGLFSALELCSKSRYLLSLPLYHVSGLSILYRTFFCGATLVLNTKSLPLSHILQSKRISHLSAVTTQLFDLLQEKSLYLPCLKVILLGGSSLSSSLLQEGLKRHLPLYASYGLTEMASTVTCKRLLLGETLHSSGYILPYRTLEISSDGEIIVSGPTLCVGYYCPKTALLEKIFSFPTGDMGYMESDRSITFKGRKDHLIISGGENIHPEEIEKKLLTFPGIKNALVLSIEDERFGSKLIACIHSQKPDLLDMLKRELKRDLPNYKQPKEWVLWPKELLPSTSKISSGLRKALRLYILERISRSSG